MLVVGKWLLGTHMILNDGSLDKNVTEKLQGKKHLIALLELRRV